MCIVDGWIILMNFHLNTEWNFTLELIVTILSVLWFYFLNHEDLHLNLVQLH